MPIPRPAYDSRALARVQGAGNSPELERGHSHCLNRRASSSMKEFRKDPPDAVVIDLDRLPSHGREAGVFLRGSKSTRLIPLLFVCTEGVEGDPEKVARVKETLPDAR